MSGKRISQPPPSGAIERTLPPPPHRNWAAPFKASSSRAHTPVPTQPPTRVGEAPISPPERENPPPRPGFGSVGKPIKVRANYFALQIRNQDLHRYTIEISPHEKIKSVRREIVGMLVKCFRETDLGGKLIVYDGYQSCFTAGKLPFTSMDFEVRISFQRNFKISIKHSGMLEMDRLAQFLVGMEFDCPEGTIQALNTLLKYKLFGLHTVVRGSFFNEIIGQGILGGGLCYVKGFRQSLRPAQTLALNIVNATRQFVRPISAIDYLKNTLGRRDFSHPLSDNDKAGLRKLLSGLIINIKTNDQSRRHKIRGISEEPIEKLRFRKEGTSETLSVAQHFNEKYNISFQFPMLPAFKAGRKGNIFLPIELCEIAEGQSFFKTLSKSQAKALLEAQCQKPLTRVQGLTKAVGFNKYNKGELAEEFGIQVTPELQLIDARILPSPELKYSEHGSVGSIHTHGREWNTLGTKMIEGGKIDFWTAINFSSKRDFVVDKFYEDLRIECTTNGMAFKDPVIPCRRGKCTQIEKDLCDLYKEMGNMHLQLLIVILPDRIGSYDLIKRVCEIKLGILSQCCQPQKVEKYPPLYLAHISRKINVKVGGQNNALVDALNGKLFRGLDEPVIVFGADVTHPRAGDKSSPSIAAVVATRDWPAVSKYAGLISAQGHRKEIIQKLHDPVNGGMIREHVLAFEKSAGILPQRILFFRDGVGEGQFYDVLAHEVTAIRESCSSIDKEYMPRITFVVVQKRHNTRLFPEDSKYSNVLPGTVVDKWICHPREFDYFLCSHNSNQGTSRPTHYHVLLDENGFTADELQCITNSLCYTYVRCNRPVAIVAPVYYAHNAAFRARSYMEGAGAAASLPSIHERLKQFMFFC